MTSPVAFELPPELAIDTNIARRVIGEFIRGQLRQAGFERAVLGLSGGIDSALVAYLTAEAIGADKLLCVLMPYRTSSPASRSDAEEVVRRLGTASELADITPMVDGFYGPETDASDLRRGELHGPHADERAVRPVGDVGRPRRGDRQQDRVADRLHDDLRRLGLCVQPGRGPLQEPGPPARPRPWTCPTRSSPRRRRRTCGPARPTRSRSGFSYPELDRLLFWRIDKRRSIDEVVALGFERDLVERVDRMVAGAEFKRQVPPIAKLGPRTAGVDYLYPRRRPGSARE